MTQQLGPGPHGDGASPSAFHSETVHRMSDAAASAADGRMPIAVVRINRSCHEVNGDDGAAHRRHGPVLGSGARRRAAATVAGHDILERVESIARHPSTARRHNDVDVACPVCGWRSTTAAEAPEAIQRLVLLARRALDHRGSDGCDVPGRMPSRSAVERVARLRDEIHITANRVARFHLEEHPVLSRVWIDAPVVGCVTLAPGALVSQLELSAARLVQVVQACSVHDGNRTARMDGADVTIEDLLNSVLHTSVHDLLDPR
jgi:hypothetical protein